jgi:integrase
MRQAMLGAVKQAFNAAIGKGRIKINPAAALTTKAPETKRERLTLDQYRKIIAVADPLLVKAMNLALLTGQRREDITRLQFSQVKDGFLWVVQGKTKAKIRIPLTLTLKAVNLSFDQAIQACRDNVLSKHLIHYSEIGNGREVIGGPLAPRAISKRFAVARDLAGIKGDNPPTFHEIRSLSGRLYRQQGIDVMTLLGHTTKQMSDLYQDDRGAEWRTVSA